MTGNYTEIIEIVAPSSAMSGETVDIEVRVRNLADYPIYIYVNGRVNGLDLDFGNYYYAVAAGGIQSFYDAFIMGSSDVTLTVWSWYKIDGWIEEADDEATKDISLTELKRLVINRDPVAGGSVTTSPAPQTGTVYDGYYPKGTTVYVTAHPSAGYTFKSWSGELTDTPNLTAPVYMTENRTVTAHFEPLSGEDILQISAVRAPSTAKAGEMVTVEVDLINNLDFSFYATPTAAVNSIELYFGDRWLAIGPGVVYTWTDTFEMPNHDVLVHVEAWAAGETYEYDTKDVRISVEEEELETLEVDITPVGRGHVVTDPASEEGRTEWVNGSTGTFPYGTQVKVTAYPDEGYVFEKWSDEIIGGVSYDNPSYVQDMTEHRAVKAHFREEAVEPVETLEVDITPVGRGYVTTDPASEEGKTTWHNGDTGTFPRGTDVQVTAHPDTGYAFEKWSDEIVGGVSYDNPAMVQTMTEHRAVKCHFEEEEEAGLETLEIDITPIGRGYVVTDPASEEGKTEWHNDETGKFPRGTSVEVTAVPEDGWVFEKWTDEIIGGISYDNPSYVQDMTEHRAAKCHFVEEGAAEPTIDEFKINKVDEQDVPPDEPIKKGVGESITVAYSFKYKVDAATAIDIWAQLYQITRTEEAQTKGTITLEKATVWKTYEDEIAIAIGDVGSGVYGLWVELPDHDAEDKIEDCIEITAAPGMMETMVPLIAIGLMAVVMMPMMKEGFK